MHRPALLLGAFALALGLGACADERYIYQPTTLTNAVVNGRAASLYEIPPEAPRGDVRVATFGMADISPEGSSAELQALHVRMVVANNDASVWTVDTREQRVELARDGVSAPAFAKSSSGAAPIVAIAPGRKESVDLFFPLPPHLQEASELPSFDVIWAVHTPARVVAERTPFERVAVEPPATSYAYGYYGWGGPYWYNPWYPGFSFSATVLPPVYVHRPIVVRPHVHSAPPARRVR